MILKAFFVVGLIRIGLFVLPFRTVQRWVKQGAGKAARRRQGPAGDAAYQRRVVRAVRAVARQTLGVRPCLTQALAVQWFFGRAGWHTDLHFGVAKEDGRRLNAHAWLEHDGEVVIGGRSSRFIYTRLRPMRPDQEGSYVEG